LFELKSKLGWPILRQLREWRDEIDEIYNQQLQQCWGAQSQCHALVGVPEERDEVASGGN
jgi:hypothetical protein